MLSAGTAVVVAADALAAELHHPGAGLHVGTVRVVGHVSHAHERVVQSLVGSDSALLNDKETAQTFAYYCPLGPLGHIQVPKRKLLCVAERL